MARITEQTIEQIVPEEIANETIEEIIPEINETTVEDETIDYNMTVETNETNYINQTVETNETVTNETVELSVSLQQSTTLETTPGQSQRGPWKEPQQ